jgi:hypothetical protein
MGRNRPRQPHGRTPPRRPRLPLRTTTDRRHDTPPSNASADGSTSSPPNSTSAADSPSSDAPASARPSKASKLADTGASSSPTNPGSAVTSNTKKPYGDASKRPAGRIVMAMDGLDTSTVDGKMVRRIRSAINHAERERHVERFDQLRKMGDRAGNLAGPTNTARLPPRPGDPHLVPDRNADRSSGAPSQRAAGRPDLPDSRDARHDDERHPPTPAKPRLPRRTPRRPATSTRPRIPPLVTVADFEAAQQRGAPRPGRGTGEPALLAGLDPLRGVRARDEPQHEPRPSSTPATADTAADDAPTPPASPPPSSTST